MGESKIIGDTACPQCRSKGRDRTGNHLMLFDDGGAYCNRCEYTENPGTRSGSIESKQRSNNMNLPDPATITGGLPAVPGASTQQMTDTQRVWYMFNGPWRSIPKDVLDFYNYQCAIDENYALEAAKHDVYDLKGERVLCEKIRTLPDKKFYLGNKIGSTDHVQLFGQKQFSRGGRRLLIVEAQEDAMSCYAAFGRKYKIACVSMVFGVQGLAQISDNIEYIKSFEEVTVLGDMDEPGQKFVDDVATILGTVKHMKIDKKDANILLEEGRGEDLAKAFFSAAPYSPPYLVTVDEAFLKCLETPLQLGTTYPWDSVTDMTYGMVDHSIISIGGGPGSGKTTLINQIKADLMFNKDEAVCTFSLEESPETTLRYMVGYLMGEKIHIPGVQYDTVKAMEIGRKLKEHMIIYDPRHYNGKWEKIEQSIRILASNGVKKFFIDPVTALAGMLSSSDGNDYINKMMIELSKLTQELPICVVLINHLNSPKKGVPHDKGGKVYAHQFTGSKGQWRFSTEMYGVERNLLSEDHAIKNTMLLRCLKHRSDGSKVGQYCRFGYIHDTGDLEDQTHLCPIDIQDDEGDQRGKKYQPFKPQKPVFVTAPPMQKSTPAPPVQQNQAVPAEPAPVQQSVPPAQELENKGQNGAQYKLPMKPYEQLSLDEKAMADTMMQQVCDMAAMLVDEQQNKMYVMITSAVDSNMQILEDIYNSTQKVVTV